MENYIETRRGEGGWGIRSRNLIFLIVALITSMGDLGNSELGQTR
jgi:hypothetical protein